MERLRNLPCAAHRRNGVDEGTRWPYLRAPCPRPGGPFRCDDVRWPERQLNRIVGRGIEAVPPQRRPMHPRPPMFLQPCRPPPALSLVNEQPGHAAEIEALLHRAFGPGRFAKVS